MGEELKLNQSDLSGLTPLIEAILNNTGAGIYVVQNRKFVYVNPFFEEISGYTMQELLGTPALNLVHPDDKALIREEVTRILREKSKANTYEYRLLKKTGEAVWVMERITSTEYMGQRAAMGSLMDINQRKVLEDELAQSDEWHRTILEEMEDAYYEVDLSGNFTFVNESTARHTGYAKKELTRMNFRQVVHEEDIDPVFSAFNNVYGSGEPNKGYGHRIIRKDGAVRYVEVAISTVRDKQGAIAGFRCVGRDVTERKQMEQKLADMATHDFLTGLPNRILLYDRFRVALAQAHRNNYKLGIISLDLDHFKEVNDNLGHATGDKLLTAMATRLSNILRSSDTVARLGGDEFLLLLQEIHCPGDAILIAEKIIDSCKEPLQIDGHRLQISTSIGIAIYPDNGEDLDILMRKSDAAMYFSKRHGGMQYKVFTIND